METVKLKGQEKMSILAELNEHRGDIVFPVIQKLLLSLLNEAREINDTSEGTDSYRIQGRISAFKELQGYFSRNNVNFTTR
jgi:hypothetical protein